MRGLLVLLLWNFVESMGLRNVVNDVLILLLTLVEKENKKRLKITDLRYDRPGSLDSICSSMLTQDSCL